MSKSLSCNTSSAGGLSAARRIGRSRREATRQQASRMIEVEAKRRVYLPDSALTACSRSSRPHRRETAQGVPGSGPGRSNAPPSLGLSTRRSVAGAASQGLSPDGPHVRSGAPDRSWCSSVNTASIEFDQETWTQGLARGNERAAVPGPPALRPSIPCFLCSSQQTNGTAEAAPPSRLLAGWFSLPGGDVTPLTH